MRHSSSCCSALVTDRPARAATCSHHASIQIAAAPYEGPSLIKLRAQSPRGRGHRSTGSVQFHRRTPSAASASTSSLVQTSLVPPQITSTQAEYDSATVTPMSAGPLDTTSSPTTSAPPPPRAAANIKDDLAYRRLSISPKPDNGPATYLRRRSVSPAATVTSVASFSPPPPADPTVPRHDLSWLRPPTDSRSATSPASSVTSSKAADHSGASAVSVSAAVEHFNAIPNPARRSSHPPDSPPPIRPASEPRPFQRERSSFLSKASSLLRSRSIGRKSGRRASTEGPSSTAGPVLPRSASTDVASSSALDGPAPPTALRRSRSLIDSLHAIAEPGETLQLRGVERSSPVLVRMPDKPAANEEQARGPQSRASLFRRRRGSQPLRPGSLALDTTPPVPTESSVPSVRSSLLGSPLDELIEELGGRRSPSPEQLAPLSRSLHNLTASTDHSQSSTIHRVAPTAHRHTADTHHQSPAARADSAASLQQDTSAFATGIDANKDAEPKKHITEHRSFLDVATSQEGTLDAAAGRASGNEDKVHSASLPPAASLSDTTPKTPRWTIEDVEQAYGRMKLLLGSMRSAGGATELGDLSVLDGDGDGSYTSSTRSSRALDIPSFSPTPSAFSATTPTPKDVFDLPLITQATVVRPSTQTSHALGDLAVSASSDTGPATTAARHGFSAPASVTSEDDKYDTPLTSPVYTTLPSMQNHFTLGERMQATSLDGWATDEIGRLVPAPQPRANERPQETRPTRSEYSQLGLSQGPASGWLADVPTASRQSWVRDLSPDLQSHANLSASSSASGEMNRIKAMDKLALFFEYANVKSALDRAALERAALLDALEEASAHISTLQSERHALESDLRSARENTSALRMVSPSLLRLTCGARALTCNSTQMLQASRGENEMLHHALERAAAPSRSPSEASLAPGSPTLTNIPPKRTSPRHASTSSRTHGESMRIASSGLPLPTCSPSVAASANTSTQETPLLLQRMELARSSLASFSSPTRRDGSQAASSIGGTNRKVSAASSSSSSDIYADHALPVEGWGPRFDPSRLESVLPEMDERHVRHLEDFTTV